jgi:integrase
LVAAQRFVRIVGPRLGRDPAVDLAALDALLPCRPTSGWHAAGTLVAGAPDRRLRRGPTLDAADLHKIVDAAGARGGELRVRDRALVALHCFSGLRPEEIVALRWEDLDTRSTETGYYGPTATVGRGGRRLRLPLLGPAVDGVEALRDAVRRTGRELTGYMFWSGRDASRPLSYRAARDVVAAACRRAELPPAESSGLRAACAYWLRARGLSEHEVAAALGLSRVRSVDRLLARHAALDAERRVREHQAD